MPARTREAGTPPPNRPKLGDPGIYEPEPGEVVRVDGVARRCRFIRFGHDHGGDFAVVVGGKPGHVLERCVFVDRVHALRRPRRTQRIRSNADVQELETR